MHRDLKLDNIMMSDTTDESIPKVVDFGLAKIIGPNETATDTFGTLGYIAPEVLLKKPYSFSADVWSFGCIIYAMLCGALPFDHKEDREKVRMTLEDELLFDLPCWDKISDAVKDLLVKMLEKDWNKRLTLDQVLNHSWFTTQRRKD